MNKKTGIGDLILIAMEKAVDGYIRLEDFAYNTHIYAKGYDRPLKKSSLSKAIFRLRTKGLVDLIDEKNFLLKLTDAGRKKAIWEAAKKFNSEDWDGYWTVVSFDIPETKRKTRDLLRLTLKQFGFEKWQNSIWITQANCVTELREFIKTTGIENWVKVFRINDLGEI